MATGSRKKQTRQRNGGRVPYLFKAAQVLRMIAEGIIPDDEDVELFDGVLYKLTKGELHNCIVGLIGDAIRPLTPEGYHVREEKSTRKDDDSLPEPDVAVCRGKRTDYVPDRPPWTRSSCWPRSTITRTRRTTSISSPPMPGQGSPSTGSSMPRRERWRSAPGRWRWPAVRRRIAIGSPSGKARWSRSMIDGQPRGPVRIGDLFRRRDGTDGQG